MSELVEKVAVAIYDAPDAQSGDCVGTVVWMSDHLFYDEVDGESVKDTARRASMPVCRSAAEAAIAAVLEALCKPSVAMVEAGGYVHTYDIELEQAVPFGQYAASSIWPAMLAKFREEQGL